MWSGNITAFCFTIAVLLYSLACVTPAMPEYNKKIFCFHVNVFRGNVALWHAVKSLLHLPSSSSLLLLIPMYFSICKCKLTKQDLLCSCCQIPSQCGWGSQLDYVMIAQNNQTLQIEVVHHHHNLERPSLAERKESRRPRCYYCANSIPCRPCGGKKY